VWATRCVHESAFHEHNAYVTLTYNDENLPPDNSLSKRELQLFFKRLRKNLDSSEPGRKIKYFAAGEYGENKGRPHYHAIIFGLSPWGNDKKEVEDSWDKGFISTGTVTYDSARYVAEYINTQYDGELAKRVYGKRTVPFKISSGGIGKKFAILEKDKIKNGQGITVRGVHVSVPRYYQQKAGVTEEEKSRLVELGEIHNHDTFVKYQKRLKIQQKAHGDADVVNAIIESRMQKTRNKRAKSLLKPKGVL